MGKPKPGHKLRIASHAESLYIRLLLELKGVQPKAIAADLGLSAPAVSNVLSGDTRGARIEAEIAHILGWADWEQLVLHIRQVIKNTARINGYLPKEGGAA
jgi:DNA transposition AAA+ family ATPase